MNKQGRSQKEGTVRRMHVQASALEDGLPKLLEHKKGEFTRFELMKTEEDVLLRGFNILVKPD